MINVIFDIMKTDVTSRSKFKCEELSIDRCEGDKFQEVNMS